MPFMFFLRNIILEKYGHWDKKTYFMGHGMICIRNGFMGHLKNK